MENRTNIAQVTDEKTGVLSSLGNNASFKNMRYNVTSEEGLPTNKTFNKETTQEYGIATTVSNDLPTDKTKAEATAVEYNSSLKQRLKNLVDDFPLTKYLTGDYKQKLEQIRLLMEFMIGKRGDEAALIMVAAEESEMLLDIPYRLVNESFEGGVGRKATYNESKNKYRLSEDKKKNKKTKDNRPTRFYKIKERFEAKLKELNLK